MNTDMEKTLYERYPMIFAQRTSIECEDGWLELLEVLCERLQFAVEHWSAPQVVATQVKRKFGVLRFQCDGGDARTESIICMAEAMSARICEVCGHPGETRSAAGRRHAFVATRCADHPMEQT